MLYLSLSILTTFKLLLSSSINESEDLLVIYYYNNALFIFWIDYTFKPDLKIFLKTEMNELELGIRPLPIDNEDFINIHPSALAEIKLEKKKSCVWKGDVIRQLSGHYLASFTGIGVSVSLVFSLEDFDKKLKTEYLNVGDSFCLQLNKKSVLETRKTFELIGSAWKILPFPETLGWGLLLSRREVVACFGLRHNVVELTLRFRRRTILSTASVAFGVWLEVEVLLKAQNQTIYFSVQHLRFDPVVKRTRLYPNPVEKRWFFIPSVEYRFDNRRSKVRLVEITGLEERGVREINNQERLKRHRYLCRRITNDSFSIKYNNKTGQEPGGDSSTISYESRCCS